MPLRESAEIIDSQTIRPTPIFMLVTPGRAIANQHYICMFNLQNTLKKHSYMDTIAHIPDTDQPRLVIVGGGFAGLKLAKELADSNFQIVLIDKYNYHQFQPLLYQVATAGLEPSAISLSLAQDFPWFAQHALPHGHPRKGGSRSEHDLYRHRQTALRLPRAGLGCPAPIISAMKTCVAMPCR
ncbi:MAG: hypothetical protein KatS3mg109_2309 [Pirellulaceae bacterium]|nr:MAG: hypothetical protein KatS3mg109_2309 [Pirellulaceae bacterium]